ncbi:U6 snRNA-associated Sm-like protein LSm2, partial [Phenoliferia sp. Uapishka_3]
MSYVLTAIWKSGGDVRRRVAPSVAHRGGGEPTEKGATFQSPCWLAESDCNRRGRVPSLLLNMLIFSVFKTLTDQEVVVELKNDLSIIGTLKSVDQFLNIKLDNIRVLDEERHPHMVAVKNCFIRGSVVRYVQLPKAAVDTQLLEDATRRESTNQSKR